MREEVAAHYRSKGYAIRERVQVRGRSGTVHAVEMVAQGPLGNLVIAFEDAGGFEGPEMHAVRRAARDIGATPVVALRQVPDGLRRQAAAAGVVVLDDDALHAPAPATPEATSEPAYPPWPDPSLRREEREPTQWPATALARPEASFADPTDLDEVVEDWGRVRPRTKSTDPGFWRYPRPGVESDANETQASQQAAAPVAPRTSFAWLDGPAVKHVEAAVPPAGASPRHRTTRPVDGRPAPTPRPTTEAGSRVAWARGTHARASGSLTRWIAAGAAFGASAAVVFYALLRLFG